MKIKKSAKRKGKMLKVPQKDVIRSSEQIIDGVKSGIACQIVINRRKLLPNKTQLNSNLEHD